jgi:hypothetical protein
MLAFPQQIEFAAAFSFMFCYFILGAEWEYLDYAHLFADPSPFRAGTEVMLAVFFSVEVITEVASTLAASYIVGLNRVTIWQALPKDIMIAITLIIGYMSGGGVSVVLFLIPQEE